MTAPQTQPQAQREPTRWRGLGLWNVYYILKFGLAWAGMVTLQPLYEVLLVAFLLWPMRSKLARRLRDFVGFFLAAALLYAESWLPGPQSILNNINGIMGFSANYILQLAVDFVNWKMVGIVAAVFAVYMLVRDWIRVTVLTVCYLAFSLVQPYLADLLPASEPAVRTADAQQGGKKAVRASRPRSLTAEIDRWYEQFLDYEKDRRAQLPAGIPEKDTPFDIAIVNICSLANDDLEASDLAHHKVFDQFDIRFDRFNSATSYSGPATLRLLNMVCGQPSHNDLYERRPDCEVMNRLESIGFKQHLYLDHAGVYDNYLSTLRDKAALTAPLESTGKYVERYMSFSNESIWDDLGVLRHWQRAMQKESAPRNVTLFNFIALHDGNRLPYHGNWEPFKPRAKKFLDDLQTFMKELDKSGRKVMLVILPEHGAAVRGDRIQAPKLRDIPSLKITDVPVMVKFFGLKNLPHHQYHVTQTTSYLAVSALIGKVISSNFFGSDRGKVPVEQLVRDLPQTNVVSENGNAIVLRYKGLDYIRLNGAAWKPYPKD